MTRSPFPRRVSADRNWGFVLLWLFGMMQWCSLGRALFVEFFGESFNRFAAGLNGVSIVLLVGAVGWYGLRHGWRLTIGARTWLIVAGAFTAACTVRGLLAGLMPKYVALDVLAFVSLFSFVILGSIPEAFADLRRVWFHLLVLSIPLNLIAMGDLGQLSVEIGNGVRVARDTVSYRTSQTLDLVLLLAGFAFALGRWQRWIVIVGFCQVIAMQVIYQKRLETFYYALSAVLFTWVWWTETGPWRARLRGYVREAAVVLLVVGGVTFAVFGRYLLPQVVALASRAKGETSDVEISRGYARYFLFDNERFQAVFDTLGTLSPAELAFGRGMGGGAEWTGFNLHTLNSTRSEEVWSAYYMEDYGFFGRREFEVGFATPILKGGIVFVVVLYSVYALYFFRARMILASLPGRVSMVIVAMQGIYAFFGGDFSVSVIFQMGTYATCLGLGLSTRGGGTETLPSGARPGADRGRMPSQP